jgi:hypothetical protein
VAARVAQTVRVDVGNAGANGGSLQLAGESLTVICVLRSVTKTHGIFQRLLKLDFP